MNILFCSVPFRPSIGGLETVSALLAERFHALGHRVVLLTQTASDLRDDEPFPVIRRPNAGTVFRWVRWADVVFHNNASLRLAWPLLLLRKPWIVAHHMWTPRSGQGAFVGRLKHWVFRFASHVAVSPAIAASLTEPATIIPNPYAEDLFAALPGIARERDLVFLGRLEPGKGAGVLLDAVALLKTRGRRAELTIVGRGSEESHLRAQAEALGLSAQVVFAGAQRGGDLVRLLCAHRLMAIPSTWEEPFGVVALEAIACGCVPIVAQSGGLPDAVGLCGVVVPKNDSAALAVAIEQLLADAESRARFVARGAEHLAEHTRDRVARRYLDVIENVYRTAR